MNPYLPEFEYVPDGEPHVFGERVYVFGSHDRFGGEKFCMNDYVAYSAKISNLADWRYEGVIYRKDQDPRIIGEDRQLWAPDVVQGKDGRYYLYYCPDGDRQGIGVAVCDTPAGKYSFYGIVHDKEGRLLGERPHDTDQFDPCVFIDDNGKIFLYSGNGFLMKKLPPEYEKLMSVNPKKASVLCNWKTIW
jgi:beta-xylosidase